MEIIRDQFHQPTINSKHVLKRNLSSTSNNINASSANILTILTSLKWNAKFVNRICYFPSKIIDAKSSTPNTIPISNFLSSPTTENTKNWNAKCKKWLRGINILNGVPTLHHTLISLPINVSTAHSTTLTSILRQIDALGVSTSTGLLTDVNGKDSYCLCHILLSPDN